jgi:hypothetical protein
MASLVCPGIVRSTIGSKARESGFHAFSSAAATAAPRPPVAAQATLWAVCWPPVATSQRRSCPAVGGVRVKSRWSGAREEEVAWEEW